MLHFAGNYGKDKMFLKTNWLCQCGIREEESHLTSGKCPIYGDLVNPNDDISNDEILVRLFSSVLKRRENIEEKQKMIRTAQI